jgi:hypothetical protein
MLAELGFLLLVAAIVAAHGLVGAARGRIRQHGPLNLAWRWLTGHPWHGKAITDAGWLRPGSKAFTPTGHAPRFHYRPRWQRAVIRSGSALATLVLVLAWASYPAVTRWFVIFVSLFLCIFAGWRAWRGWQSRQHRKSFVYPLHKALAPLTGVPLPARPGSWLAIEPDRSRAVIALPPGFEFDPKMQQRILAIASAKLGLEAPDPEWRKVGPRPELVLTASQPPPALVTLADIMPAIEAAKRDELVWGLGKRRKVVKNSLSGDSPHIGLSMGSGAGKSATARALLAQMLYHGAIGLILDYKMISHQWAKDLPNVVIARRPAEIHAALVWLGGEGGELERRNEVALAGSDIEGNVHAVVGPRLIVICEELNATMSRLRKYWNHVRAKDDPKRSPALDGLDAASFMGRQVECHIAYIGQRLSVKAAGGDGDARENIGLFAFGRYSPSNWKMLAGDHPMPPKSLAPGRLQVVAGGVTEVQAVKMSAREARHLALAGTVSPLPAGMPGARRVTGAPLTEISGPDQPLVTVSAPPAVTGPQLVSLLEAVEQGVVSVTLGALRMARFRDGGFPAAAEHRGTAKLYDPTELAEWEASR